MSQESTNMYCPEINEFTLKISIIIVFIISLIVFKFLFGNHKTNTSMISNNILDINYNNKNDLNAQHEDPVFDKSLEEFFTQ
jgi:hypothetical protein